MASMKVITPALRTNWRKFVAPYQHSDLTKSIIQLANSFIPFLIGWALMIYSLRISPWLTLALVIPTALFEVRMFIIFHDCGHGSFFNSQKANSLVGFIMGVFVLTPSEDWWHQHALHHATAGNLDKRGYGDVMTLTVEEYQQSTPWKRFMYGFFRHPLVMFTFGPLYIFAISNRFASKNASKKQRQSVVLTNLALLAITAILCLTIGWANFLLIMLPLTWLAGALGIWMFYIQHQYENVYWERNNAWDFVCSALQGASYYKLPRIAQWFTGNIGFHHIHHLSPRIPNYFLEKCFNETPEFQDAEIITLRASLRSLPLRLWDEQSRKLVSFAAIHKTAAAVQPGSIRSSAQTQKN